MFALESALSRAYWNGFLKLSFVSCPVALYPATTAAEPSTVDARWLPLARDNQARFAISDPVDLTVAPFGSLAVSL